MDNNGEEGCIYSSVKIGDEHKKVFGSQKCRLSLAP
jgi:hypothetical protein